MKGYHSETSALSDSKSRNLTLINYLFDSKFLYNWKSLQIYVVHTNCSNVNSGSQLELKSESNLEASISPDSKSRGTDA